MANIYNPESVLSISPLSNNTMSSRIADMADDVKSILIQDLQYSKFSLTVDRSSFVNQSILAFVHYIKDSIICHTFFMINSHQHYSGTSVQRCHRIFKDK